MEKDISIAQMKLGSKKENRSSRRSKIEQSSPSGMFADRVQFLQRTIGNHAVEKMIRSGTLHAHELSNVHQQRSSSNGNLIDRYPQGALEEQAINRGEKTQSKTSTNSETGVKICYVPLSIFPKWLPKWAAPANHAFIEFDDGWSAGFTMREGESKEDARIISHEPRKDDPRKWCFKAERKDSEECQAKSVNEIKTCIQNEAKKDPGKYHLIQNNCGDWVKKTFNNCCLKPKTPWHIY